MEDKELQEFTLEDILEEFADGELESEVADEIEAVLSAEESEEESQVEEAPQTQVTGDTIRLDAIQLPKGQVRNAAPIAEEEPKETELPQEEKQEPFSDQWEPEYEQPMGEYLPPQPILFHPRSRLRELKRKLVAGPEKRYYALLEMGLGKLQAAIFLSVLVVLISAIATGMYAMGMVQENRMRLMVFGQFLAMLVSALLGSFQLIEGVADLFRKRFTLNTLLVITFVACCIDGVLGLQQLRVSCCAAFSLEMTMSLWSAYQRRNAEMGQMDTMRKATHLDSIGICEDYYNGKKGLLRGEGQVEDFMEHYYKPSRPEKALNWFAFVALLASIGIGVTAGLQNNDPYLGIQVCAVCLLVAVPATSFITFSRPMALLERRLHGVGTVLCGWEGVKALCGKAVVPLCHTDLFPEGSVRMNGVKFYGGREPEEIIAYGTALIVGAGDGLSSLFTQVLDSRNGRHYDAQNICSYEMGGLGGSVEDSAVLVGNLSFLKHMGVEIPEGIRVNQAVCVAIDGEFCGLFAVSYEKVKTSAAGLVALCAYHGLYPMVSTKNFMLTEKFIRSNFGVRTRRMIFANDGVQEELEEKTLNPESRVAALTVKDGLLPIAYGITGARAVRTACRIGVTIHLLGGILGLSMVLALTLLGAFEQLTPANMFLYHLVWMIPGLLITEWTRSI